MFFSPSVPTSSENVLAGLGGGQQTALSTTVSAHGDPVDRRTAHHGRNAKAKVAERKTTALTAAHSLWQGPPYS
jgi:hypothetical protein